MSYSMTVPLQLGAAQTGLGDAGAATLRARLHNPDGSTTSLPGIISTGFVETNTPGTYAFTYASWPAGFNGYVDITTGSTALGSFTVNPTDYENPAQVTTARAAKLDDLDATVSSRAATADSRFAHLDADVSSRADAAQYTTARAAKLDDLDATISSRAATADSRLAHLDADISSVRIRAGG